MAKIVSIKLGGSVIFEKDTAFLDFGYLERFKNFLSSQTWEDYKFILNVGGGKLAKTYQDISKEKGFSDNDTHWVGTAASVMNAYLVRGFLGDELCEKDVFKFEDYRSEKEPVFEKRILVGGGSRPGHSNEYNALMLASKFTLNEVFVLKDVNGVYSEDPDKNPEAKLMEEMSWDKYTETIGSPQEFVPKAALPVDVVAAKEAKEKKFTFYVLNGLNFENLERALKGEKFVGTRITA